MTSVAVALDLLREAAARRWFLALGLALTGLLMLLLTSLRLEVVDGALAASRLFEQPLSHSIQAADVALRPVFLVASQIVFWGGLSFGVLSCADFAPALLSPGRIEHLLSLPVRRWELLAGTFLGVLALALPERSTPRRVWSWCWARRPGCGPAGRWFPPCSPRCPSGACTRECSR
jgi:Cu-processing system permease protein